ncbi:MAG: methyltransferase domain-containing protein [Verrucomicrobiae bacterium]|nr:methyltransferase domain-containing protein [Verrucomicrobiae bacterium]NNJ43632.1 class I SAM-dependent methyltransferase [Akkermansiaceae bacterium]
MPPKFSNVHTDGDLTQLRELLAGTLEQSGVPLPNGSTKRFRNLLNLACGRADETAVLADVFGQGAENIHLTGVDIRAREIGEAQERWKHLQGNTQADFLVQDASKLSDLRELDNHFDVAFMRHQNFWNGDTTWSKIYDEALHRLDHDGLLVITSYFDREHQLALDAIQGLGAQLVCSQRNHASRVLTDARNKSVDRHVAIFKKP